MTELLNRAFAQISALPEAHQDMFAMVLLAAISPDDIAPLDEAARSAIREGVEQAKKGEFASHGDIAALCAHYGC